AVVNSGCAGAVAIAVPGPPRARCTGFTAACSLITASGPPEVVAMRARSRGHETKNLDERVNVTDKRPGNNMVIGSCSQQFRLPPVEALPGPIHLYLLDLLSPRTFEIALLASAQDQHGRRD